MFCLHANPPEAFNAIRHDPAANNLSVCVMSYQNCEGHYCAKCLFALRGWNLADPPDDLERGRNAAIEKLQNNRNPFVDRPDFVDRISDY